MKRDDGNSRHRGKNGKILTVLLVILLVLVGGATCSVFWLYKIGRYSTNTLALAVSVFDVLASIVAGAFIVAQLQNESQSDEERAKIEEAKFILELNTSFIENSELCQIEHYLEDQITHQGTGKIASLIEARQALVNYLVYLEGVASCVHQNMMLLDDIDNIFSYRFFLAMNHPEVQMLEIIPYADYYLGNYQLFDDWYQYRMNKCGKDYLKDARNCNDVIPLAETSLFLAVDYEKHLKEWINVYPECDTDGNRTYRTRFKKDGTVFCLEKDGKFIIENSGKEVKGRKIPTKIQERLNFVIEKNKKFFDGYKGYQLDASSSLTERQYLDISELIYETDPYIYPALFGEGETGRNNAKQILPVIIASGIDAMFRRSNLFVFSDKDSVAGIILWYKGNIQWNAKTILLTADKIGIKLSEDNVNAVAREYVEPRYSCEETELEIPISLVNICVSKKMRGMGIGRLMMTEFFAKHPTEKMKLCVIQNNKCAVHLYEALGFKIEKESIGFSLEKVKPMCYDMVRS